TAVTGRPAETDGWEADERSGLGPVAQRTRRRLLETAQKVFAERGFYATRVDDIVAAAEVSHGIFYRYFGSKSEILRILADRALHELGEMYQDICSSIDLDGGSVHDSLVEWLGRLTDTSAHNMAIIAAWT